MDELIQYIIEHREREAALGHGGQYGGGLDAWGVGLPAPPDPAYPMSPDSVSTVDLVTGAHPTGGPTTPPTPSMSSADWTTSPCTTSTSHTAATATITLASHHSLDRGPDQVVVPSSWAPSSPTSSIASADLLKDLPPLVNTPDDAPRTPPRGDGIAAVAVTTTTTAATTNRRRVAPPSSPPTPTFPSPPTPAAALPTNHISSPLTPPLLPRAPPPEPPDLSLCERSVGVFAEWPRRPAPPYELEGTDAAVGTFLSTQPDLKQSIGTQTTHDAISTPPLSSIVSTQSISTDTQGLPWPVGSDDSSVGHPTTGEGEGSHPPTRHRPPGATTSANNPPVPTGGESFVGVDTWPGLFDPSVGHQSIPRFATHFTIVPPPEGMAHHGCLPSEQVGGPLYPLVHGETLPENNMRLDSRFATNRRVGHTSLQSMQPRRAPLPANVGDVMQEEGVHRSGGIPSRLAGRQFAPTHAASTSGASPSYTEGMYHGNVTSLEEDEALEAHRSLARFGTQQRTHTASRHRVVVADPSPGFVGPAAYGSLLASDRHQLTRLQQLSYNHGVISTITAMKDLLDRIPL